MKILLYSSTGVRCLPCCIDHHRAANAKYKADTITPACIKPYFLAAGVVLLMQLLESGLRYVGINLSGRYIAMT